MGHRVKSNRITNRLVHEHDGDPDYAFRSYHLDEAYVGRPKDGDYGKGGVV